MSVPAPAQDAPAFRYQPPLRPVVVLPHVELNIPRAEIPLPLVSTAVAPASPRQRDRPYVPLALRRQRQRNLDAQTAHDTFTLRLPDRILAQLSIGMQSELRFSDNISSAPDPLAHADEVFEFTPVAHLSAGGIPGLQPERSLEPEYYLDALYAPTSHQLLRAGESAFLEHFDIHAGRATAVAHTGARFSYHESIFAASGDSSTEENFTSLEVEPVIEYRTSAKTTLHGRGNYRRITLDQPDGNRSEFSADAGIDIELSPKTTAGVGGIVGHIDFDNTRFGKQDYGQAYAALTWRATPKMTFRTQTGVEKRKFSRPIPKPDQTTPVSVAVLDWRASETTRVAAAFRIENQPSVSQGGALFREMKTALEAEHDFGGRFYARGEVEYVERRYDSGRDEEQLTLRPALGYHLSPGAVFDSMKLEFFYQFRQHWNSDTPGYDRSQGGLQLTVFF